MRRRLWLILRFFVLWIAFAPSELLIPRAEAEIPVIQHIAQWKVRLALNQLDQDLNALEGLFKRHFFRTIVPDSLVPSLIEILESGPIELKPRAAASLAAILYPQPNQLSSYDLIPNHLAHLRKEARKAILNQALFSIALNPFAKGTQNALISNPPVFLTIFKKRLEKEWTLGSQFILSLSQELFESPHAPVEYRYSWLQQQLGPALLHHLLEYPEATNNQKLSEAMFFDPVQFNATQWAIGLATAFRLHDLATLQRMIHTLKTIGDFNQNLRELGGHNTQADLLQDHLIDFFWAMKSHLSAVSSDLLTIPLSVFFFDQEPALFFHILESAFLQDLSAQHWLLKKITVYAESRKLSNLAQIFIRNALSVLETAYSKGSLHFDEAQYQQLALAFSNPTLFSLALIQCPRLLHFFIPRQLDILHGKHLSLFELEIISKNINSPEFTRHPEVLITAAIHSWPMEIEGRELRRSFFQKILPLLVGRLTRNWRSTTELGQLWALDALQTIQNWAAPLPENHPLIFKITSLIRVASALKLKELQFEAETALIAIHHTSVESGQVGFEPLLRELQLLPSSSRRIETGSLTVVTRCAQELLAPLRELLKPTSATPSGQGDLK